MRVNLTYYINIVLMISIKKIMNVKRNTYKIRQMAIKNKKRNIGINSFFSCFIGCICLKDVEKLVLLDSINIITIVNLGVMIYLV